MSLRIVNNVEAFGAHRRLVDSSDRMAKSMERLSSGFRINRGGDDAAGLGISERMRAQSTGLGQAQRNIQDGISLLQTAEGNLEEVHSMLQRVRELAVQYKNGSLSTADRTAIDKEVLALASEVERVRDAAQFNGISLLASDTALLTFQIGADDNDKLAVRMVDITGATNGVGTAYYSLTQSGTTDLNEDRKSVV